MNSFDIQDFSPAAHFPHHGPNTEEKTALNTRKSSKLRRDKYGTMKKGKTEQELEQLEHEEGASPMRLPGIMT